MLKNVLLINCKSKKVGRLYRGIILLSGIFFLFLPTLVFSLPLPPHPPYTPPQVTPSELELELPSPPRAPASVFVSEDDDVEENGVVALETGEGEGEEAGGVFFKSPIQFTTIPELVNTIINWLFWVGLILFPLIIIVGGFSFMTAGGKEAKVKMAKDLIFWAIVGLVIILMSKVLISIILGVLGT